jgi:hypothetical protein
MGRARAGTSGATETLPNTEQPGTTVAEKLEQSLPQLDINLTSDIKNAEHDSQPMNDELRAALQARVRVHRKPSRRRADQEPIQLDPGYLTDPAKMNYALLLALLLREKGEVALTAADLERTDDAYNILFALSLDGKQLVVSVVSTESGIIRSPEAKWAQNQTLPTYAPPPLPGAGEAFLPNAATIDPRQFAAAVASQSFLPHALPTNDQRVVTMPTPAPPGTTPPRAPTADAAAAGQAPGYVFPFDVGPAPHTAGPMNLDNLQVELQRDQHLAMEERAAAAKLEGRG